MLMELAINILASILLVAGGLIGGKYRERRLQQGSNL